MDRLEATQTGNVGKGRVDKVDSNNQTDVSRNNVPTNEEKPCGRHVTGDYIKVLLNKKEELSKEELHDLLITTIDEYIPGFKEHLKRCSYSKTDRETLSKFFEHVTSNHRESLEKLFESFGSNKMRNRIAFVVFLSEVRGGCSDQFRNEVFENFLYRKGQEYIKEYKKQDLTNNDSGFPEFDETKIHPGISREQYKVLKNHIEDGVELIKQNKFKEAIKHFSNTKTAAQLRLGLDVQKREINEGDGGGGFYAESKDNRLIGEIKYGYLVISKEEDPESLKTLTKHYKKIALGLLEEWLHAAQDITGSTISSSCRSVESLAMFSRREIDNRFKPGSKEKYTFKLIQEAREKKRLEISDLDLLTLQEEMFGKPITVRDLERFPNMTYMNLVELDIPLFFRERGIKFDYNFLENHDEVRPYFLDAPF